MTDEQKPEDKRKASRGGMIGAFIALGAGGYVVFNNAVLKNKPETPPAETAQQSAPDDTSVQTAQFGHVEAAPTAPQVPPPELASAISSSDGAVSFKDESLAFEAVFPAGLVGDPPLTAIRNDALGFLLAKKAEARAAYDEFKKQGAGSPIWPWEVAVKWDYTAKAGDIVSLAGSAYEFTGGAHGNTQFDTHVARANGATVKVADMLQGGITPALVIGICEALKVEKVKRIGVATVYDDPVNCAGPDANVKIEAAKLALAPSSETGKFGGVLVYWGPYDVGPYVEGPYEIVVQQEVFAQDLKPEFKPLFGGTAPPLRD